MKRRASHTMTVLWQCYYHQTIMADNEDVAAGTCSAPRDLIVVGDHFIAAGKYNVAQT